MHIINRIAAFHLHKPRYDFNDGILPMGASSRLVESQLPRKA